MLSRPRGALKYQISPSGFLSSNTKLFTAQPPHTRFFMLFSVPPPSPFALPVTHQAYFCCCHHYHFPGTICTLCRQVLLFPLKPSLNISCSCSAPAGTWQLEAGCHLISSPSQVTAVFSRHVPMAPFSQRGFHSQLRLLSPNSPAVDGLQLPRPLCLLPFLSPTQCHWLVSLQTGRAKFGFTWTAVQHLALMTRRGKECHRWLSFKCVFLTFLLNGGSKQNIARSMWLMENAVDGLHKD